MFPVILIVKGRITHFCLTPLVHGRAEVSVEQIRVDSVSNIENFGLVQSVDVLGPIFLC